VETWDVNRKAKNYHRSVQKCEWHERIRVFVWCMYRFLWFGGTEDGISEL